MSKTRHDSFRPGILRLRFVLSKKAHQGTHLAPRDVSILRPSVSGTLTIVYYRSDRASDCNDPSERPHFVGRTTEPALASELL